MIKNAIGRGTGPLFIVGVGRSGTSLLQSMLASHPLLSFSAETAFVRRFVARARLRTAISHGNLKAAEVLLKGDSYFKRTGIDPKILLQRVNERGAVTDAAVYLEMLKMQAEHNGKPIAGDKDPRCVEYLGLIRAVLPDAHVIHAIRDPRDVLLSRKRAKWSSGRSTTAHAFAARVQLELGCQQGPALFGERYHEIIYENLVQDPEAVLGCLCDRIGVPYDSAMLDFAGAAKKLVTPEEMEWKKETMGPLLRGNNGKWKNALSKREIALVEESVSRPFDSGVYRRSDALRKLSAYERSRVRALASWIRAWTPAYVTYRKFNVRRAREAI